MPVKKMGSRELTQTMSPRTGAQPMTPTASSAGRRYVKGSTLEKPPNNAEAGVMGILVHPLNLLLLCLPVGVAASYYDMGDIAVFWWNFGAMIPLAKILGDATEELAASLQNDMIAGILNATFGNAVELIIMIHTLRSGLYDVVKATLIGSVISNTLLVLGCSFLCGGLLTYQKDFPGRPASSTPLGSNVSYDKVAQDSRPSRPEELDQVPSMNRPISRASIAPLGGPYNAETEKVQSFGVLGALVNTSMLLCACTALWLVTAFDGVMQEYVAQGGVDQEHIDYIVLKVSRVASIIIILAYVAFIVFQLVTHRQTMAEDQPESEEDGEERLSVLKSMLLLFVATILTAFSSELMVTAIAGVTKKAHLSRHFIGMIVLPIVGNACEHAAAVRFAMHDKLGLSVSIAIGSATQIALFVVPFAVLMGWAMHKPLDLNFGNFVVIMITLSVIAVLSMIVDGHSNWLQGYLLCSLYAIVAVLFYYLPDDVSTLAE